MLGRCPALLTTNISAVRSVFSLNAGPAGKAGGLLPREDSPPQLSRSLAGRTLSSVFYSASELTGEIKYAPVAQSTDSFASYCNLYWLPSVPCIRPLLTSLHFLGLPNSWPSNPCLGVSLDSGLQTSESVWLF